MINGQMVPKEYQKQLNKLKSNTKLQLVTLQSKLKMQRRYLNLKIELIDVALAYTSEEM